MVSAPHAAPQSGLPRPLTSHIGRDRELSALVGLLQRDDVRLLTLTGPGGVGKTRLAIRVAEAAAEDFPDGVWFVSLAATRAPGLVESTIAQALGLRQTRGEGLVERVTNVLSDKNVLLIVDNFEHVLEAAPLLAELLAACAALKCMVTSRTLLQIAGEHTFPVPPLPVPPSARETSAERAGLSAAVQLFVARAQAARPDFALSDRNAGEVESICRRLDGLPLAIELAAARIRHLTPAELLGRPSPDEPGSGLRMLSHGPRDAPDRHRGLRRAIEWSHDLLSADERALFRRLGLFIDGFTTQAARAVAEAQGGLGIDIEEGIASLADQSLLWRKEDGAGTSRYGMLETIREFALEQLATDPDEARAAREAHALYLLALAEMAAPQLHSERHMEWLGIIDAEQANLRAALTWFEEADRAEELIRLAWALFWFWWFWGHLVEGRDWYERALAADGTHATTLRPLALFGAAQFAEALTAFDQAEAMVREGLALEQATGESLDRGRFEFMLAVSAFRHDNIADAVALGDSAVNQLRQAGTWEGDVWLRIALNDIGLSMVYAGLSERGITLIEEALALAERAGDRHLAGVHWSDLGLATQTLGDNSKAEIAFRQAAHLLRSVGYEWYLAVPLAGIAACTVQRDPARAATMFGAAEALRERSGQPNLRIERQRDKRAIATLRVLLGDELLAAERARGHAMALDEILNLAVGADAEDVAAFLEWERSHPLSPRERDVLRLLVANRSDREIADALFISRRTASKHVGSILGKLNVASRREAAERAVRDSLV